MSDVVTMQDKPFDATQSGDAKIALRALLEKLDAGEIVLHRWMLVFEVLVSSTDVTRSNLSSDMTAESACMLLEQQRLDILMRLRGQ